MGLIFGRQTAEENGRDEPERNGDESMAQLEKELCWERQAREQKNMIE